jgi:hypothetical protein
LIVLLTATFGALASLTRWPDWAITEPEARSIAEPAARIIARHAHVAAVVKTVADPIALIVAAAAVTVPRVIGYRLAYAAALAEARAAQAQAPQAGPAAAPPPQSNPGGATAVNFAERLLRENGL